MKPRLIAIVTAGILSTISGNGLAEDETPGQIYLVPSIGIMNTDSDLKADDDVAYGLRIGKELSQHWDVQIGLSHADADEDSSRFSGGEYKQTIFGVDALYMFSRDKFRPFLLAGLGAAHNSVDYDAGTSAAARGSNTSWMGNVGLGFQYLVTETIGLQADLRHVWSNAESRTLFGTGRHDETIGNTYLNLGVVFRFDAPKQAAAQAAEPLPEIAATQEAAMPVLSDPGQQVVTEPAFDKITLKAEVLFDFDSSMLKPAGKQVLDTEVTGKMQAHPEVELVLITGHTDFLGDSAYNLKLSENRAVAVKNYLVSKGIAESRLHTVGKGEKEPVADCKGMRGKKLVTCLQPNRRVVVEVEASK